MVSMETKTGTDVSGWENWEIKLQKMDEVIELALQLVKHCNIAKVIFSDSLSCLQAIKTVN